MEKRAGHPAALHCDWWTAQVPALRHSGCEADYGVLMLNCTGSGLNPPLDPKPPALIYSQARSPNDRLNLN